MLKEKLLVYHFFPVTVVKSEWVQNSDGAGSISLKHEIKGIFSFVYKLVVKHYLKPVETVDGVKVIKSFLYRYIAQECYKFCYIQAVIKSIALRIRLQKLGKIHDEILITSLRVK